MVNLFYARVDMEAFLDSFDLYLEKLPLRYSSSISACKNPNTRVLRLASRLLLDRALKLTGVPDGVVRVAFTPSGRPFVAGGPDFNISHSGEYVVCAFSRGKRVGVDIEKIREVDPSGFGRYFSPEQLLEIKEAEDPRKEFFKNWTHLESLLKAQGDGFTGGVPEIKREPDGSTILKGIAWCTQEIKITSGYFCSVTVNTPEAEVSIKNIVLDRY